MVIGLDNSGKSTIINQVLSATHGVSSCHCRRLLELLTTSRRLNFYSPRSQLKPKKTAVVEATPTVGMSIEAFSKVHAVPFVSALSSHARFLCRPTSILPRSTCQVSRCSRTRLCRLSRAQERAAIVTCGSTTIRRATRLYSSLTAATSSGCAL